MSVVDIKSYGLAVDPEENKLYFTAEEEKQILVFQEGIGQHILVINVGETRGIVVDVTNRYHTLPHQRIIISCRNCTTKVHMTCLQSTMYGVDVGPEELSTQCLWSI